MNFEKVVDLAVEAGQAVMEVYSKESFTQELKSDNSPLTEADKNSHNVIVDGLANLTPDTPVISEESEDVSWEERKKYSKYWLVDPLDGTKEFLKRNGEFTVNIALIEEHKPVFGVVYAPALNVLYFGSKDEGAYKRDSDGVLTELKVNTQQFTNGHVWKIVGSRSHQSDDFKSFVEQFQHKEIVSMGSSLKLCLVAEGVADIYPRLGPTSEWDTAAAQAVVEAAGGEVLDAEGFEPLLYNKNESILNPEFIVCGNPQLPWYKKADKGADNIVWHQMSVDKAARSSRFGQKPAIIWFTGLSGSGKSTSACALEKCLFSKGYNTYLLDGDNVRHGLCSDLGFSDRDRGENIRRVGEVAKLMVDAGFIVLTSFISPFARERQIVRQMVGPGEFIEVFVDTPIEECEKRDPKGLYKKARAGEISKFTGIDSPYEAPEDPEITVDTKAHSVEEIVGQIEQSLARLGITVHR